LCGGGGNDSLSHSAVVFLKTQNFTPQRDLFAKILHRGIIFRKDGQRFFLAVKAVKYEKKIFTRCGGEGSIGKRLKIPFLYQVTGEESVDFYQDNIRLISVDRFLSGLV